MASATNGSLTERYQIKKHLGSGGNGDAYLAFDTSLRREIVIKRVRAGEHDGKLRQEILEEAARMAALKHIHDPVLTYRLERGSRLLAMSVPYFFAASFRYCT